MTINITLPPDIEQRIANAAESRNMPVEDYILSLVETAHPRINPAPLAGESREEFRAAMMSLSKVKTPSSLSEETWDRATIYGDHA